MICGPIISTDDLKAQTALYEDCFGLTAGSAVELSGEATSELCGTSSIRLTSRWLSTAETPFGVRLWSFDPPAAETVRDPARGTDRDAPKVVDFYAPDFSGAIHHLSDQGRDVKGEMAEYAIEAGTMQEAHLWGPDHVVSAVISGPPTFFKDFATVHNRTFSEPQSISTPVTDIDQAVSFYADVFGYDTVYEYRFEHQSFDDMVGTATPIQLRGVNVGTSTREPYLGLIDYGAHQPESQSLKGKARPPVRGLVGAELTTDNLDKTIDRAIAFGDAAFLGQPVSVNYEPFGKAASVLIEAPHGVLHHVVEYSRAARRVA